MDEIERMRETDRAEHKWANNVSWNIWFDWKAICRFDRKMSIIYHWWHTHRLTRALAEIYFRLWPQIWCVKQCKNVDQLKMAKSKKPNDRQIWQTVTHEHWTLNRNDIQQMEIWILHVIVKLCGPNVINSKSFCQFYVIITHISFFCLNACSEWASSARINGMHQ